MLCAGRIWLPLALHISRILQTINLQPRLKGVALSALASALGISIPYAVDVRKGRRVLHPRHWQSLAVLVNVLPDD
jgi:hypothetical protein